MGPLKIKIATSPILTKLISSSMRIISYFLFFCLSSCFLNTWDSRLLLVNQTGKKIFFREVFQDENTSTMDTTNCSKASFYDVEAKGEQRIHSQNKFEVYFRKHPKAF
jgi:hypothetical protein